MASARQVNCQVVYWACLDSIKIYGQADDEVKSEEIKLLGKPHRLGFVFRLHVAGPLV